MKAPNASIKMEGGMLHMLGNHDIEEPAKPDYVATDRGSENSTFARIRMRRQALQSADGAQGDYGILDGLAGPDKVWPTKVECQIEVGDVGDYFLVGGIRGVQNQHAYGIFGEGLTANRWTGPENGSRAGPQDSPIKPTEGQTHISNRDVGRVPRLCVEAGS